MTASQNTPAYEVGEIYAATSGSLFIVLARDGDKIYKKCVRSMYNGNLDAPRWMKIRNLSKHNRKVC
jgi:hypothetical protein